MAAISSLSGAQTALRLFDGASPVSARNRTASASGLPLSTLPDGTRSQSSDYISLSNQQGATLVGNAVSAGQSVSADLAELRQLVVRAQSAEVQAGVADTGATGLDAQARVILDRIDATVSAATFAGANLVRSGSSDVRVNTEAAGGAVLAAVQSLDSAGLALTGLDLSSNAGALQALSRIDAAIGDAFVKTQRIDALSRNIASQGTFVNALSSFSAQSGAAALRPYGASGAQATTTTPRGSFVNIVA